MAEKNMKKAFEATNEIKVENEIRQRLHFVFTYENRL